MKATALAILAALGLLGSSGASAHVHAGPAGERATVERKAVGKAPEKIVAHWTQRRMRGAEPRELLRTAHGTPERQPLLHTGSESYEEGDTTSYPNRTHGKVFFEVGGQRYVCSGTVVPSASDDLVATAGHCIYDTGGTDDFATNVVFVPGYRDSTAPFGIWAAESLATTTQWRAGNFNYDVAFAKVAPVADQELEAVVGARGIAFNQPREQAYEAFGYPAASPFDGQSLQICDSAYIGDDPYYTPPGPAPIGIGCDMTGGSSGGGWVTTDGYVASVTSFGYDTSAEADHLYGPYFETVAKELYAAVDGAPGTPADRVAGDDTPPADHADDDTPPETTITAGPADGSTTSDPTPTFAFTASEPASSFRCVVDDGAAAPCSSPRTVATLDDGQHLFTVWATDPSGNPDPTPAYRVFTVDARVSAPRVLARRVQPQRDGRIVLRLKAGAGEPVQATAGGRVAVRGAKRSFPLRAVRKSVPADQLSTYRLVPARAAHNRRITRLLKRGHTLRGRLAVRFRDEAANAETLRKSVRLVVR